MAQARNVHTTMTATETDAVTEKVGDRGSSAPADLELQGKGISGVDPT